MNSPPASRPSNADKSAPPAAEARLTEVRADGALLKRVAQGAADELVSRGWAEWIGRGNRRYLALTDGAPLSALRSRLVSDGTRPVRGDGTCRIYGTGQLMGDKRSVREFIPVR